MDERRGLADRLRDVSDGRERLVVHVDELGPILGERPTLGHDDRDPVTGVARLVRGQGMVLGNAAVTGHRPGTGKRVRPLVRELGAGERRHDAVCGERPRDVDLLDPGVCVGAAHDRHPEHPRDRHVVHPACLTAEQAGVLSALDRSADVGLLGFRGCHLPSPQAAAAAFTALTMFW